MFDESRKVSNTFVLRLDMNIIYSLAFNPFILQVKGGENQMLLYNAHILNN